MANPGVGNKFVSVNLNKSYGPSHSHQNHSNNSYGSGRGGGGGRGSGGGGGGGGGMVVLSRPRSANKVGTKLSVPPPLNLPSLRREHEKFDSSGTGGTAAASGGVAAGRPSSSGVGWSKPSVAAVVVDGGAGDRPVSSDGGDRGVVGVGVGDGVGRGGLGSGSGSAAYLPPSARMGAADRPDVSAPVSIGKASVLRGEDFPSLRATLAAANVTAQKQKDSGNQRQRQGASEEISGGQKEGSGLSSHIDMRPQMQSSQSSAANGFGDDRMSRNNRQSEQGRKQDDIFLGPLPLVRLSPRSDWADDERDTSHHLADRGRDHGYSRPEAYWDRDFDLPRASFPPHKPVQNSFDRRGQRDDDVGKKLSNEVSKADPFSRDVRVPSREGRDGHPWRTPVSRDGPASREVVSEENRFGPRPASASRETAKENKFTPPQYGSNNRDTAGNKDFGYGRRDSGYVQAGRQQWNNSVDTNNGRVAERSARDPYGSESGRYKYNTVQNNMGYRNSFSARGFSGGDHSSHFTRDKRSFSRAEKPYTEDPFMKELDSQDPFSTGILGVVKRKKDANKQLDFHDPARESFEAELERVQKIQEQERRRVMEEQERATEMARREEEERQRVAREQEDRQRRVHEEAREAAWRAEQEKLQAVQRAEEQRLAREAEKQRSMMEEERRKQAAKQKLLELEERIARRQAEATKDSSSLTQGDMVKDRDISRADDFAGWEDGERMVERITNTASSDSSFSRGFDLGSGPGSVREGSFAFTERGNQFSTWRRDMFDDGNNSSFFSVDHENGHQSPRREAPLGGRAFPRKDFYGGGRGYMPTRGYYRGGIPEPHMDEFPQARGHRWNISGEGDPYARNTEMEPEFHDNFADRFDVGWGQGQGRGRGNSSFPERMYQTSELDDIYSYGRSRYHTRQPRVLPPPTLPSIHRPAFRSENDHVGSAAYEDRNIQFSHASQSEPPVMSLHHIEKEKSDILDIQEQSAKNREQDLNRSTTPGCDSQSSLCVSSPPSSPTQLSHDDLDESKDVSAVSGVVEGQGVSCSENETPKAGNGDAFTSAISITEGDDEEWTVENNEELEEQVEYEEDTGYREEDEVHEVDERNLEINRDFEDMHLEEKDSSHMDNLVLGFDQGVEVVLPSDEYERSPRNDNNLYAGSEVPVNVTEQEPDDGRGSGQCPHATGVSQHVSTDCSGMTSKETEIVVPDYASGPNTISHVSSGDSSAAQPPLQSPVGSSSQSSAQGPLPSVAGAQSTSELPVKLQFGLFSGPSLIPSPVPAIQIGSIQMPLQLHPQIGPSLSHMHAPQPPLFQFGQLRYPSPISQGILPLGPQSLSFVQPNAQPNYPASQGLGGPVSVHPVQDAPGNSVKDNALLFTVNRHHIQHLNQQGTGSNAEAKEANANANANAGLRAGDNILSHQKLVHTSSTSTDPVRPESGRQNETVSRSYNNGRNARPVFNKASEGRSQVGPSSSHSAYVRDSYGQQPVGRGRRFAFTAKNAGGRLSASSTDTSRHDGNGFHRRPRRGTQRFEFRVRQTADVKQSSALTSSSYLGDAKSGHDGKVSRTEPKNLMMRESSSGKPKEQADSETSGSHQIATQEAASMVREEMTAGKQTSVSGLDTSLRAEGSLKRNISTEDDVDAPLQSGIVRVFQQPGIEAPSDEDDFIEVRSKRQMLNDRREQREREIIAKSNSMKKAPRKPRTAAQGSGSGRNTNRTSAPSNAQTGKSIQTAAASKRGFINNEVTATKTLAPIGTPPVSSDSHATKARAMRIPPATKNSSIGQMVGPGLSYDLQNKALDGIHLSSGSWDNSRIDQSVMTLTQTQLEEAMKPIQFEKNTEPVADRSSSVSELGLSSSSVPVKDGQFSSATSPISSLLAGEKIQFGAVTSPAILPPSTHVSHSIRPPAPSQMGIQIPQSIALTDNGRSLLFVKDKHSNQSCSQLEDCEAQAEAAASAVVVAAIGTDEALGNGVGGSSASASDSKGCRDPDTDGVGAGMSAKKQFVSQSKAEETLSVSLPADLSVETPPMSIWPPLPSPHSTSNPMLSAFPGAPTSHFPFYDMNPMMGKPVFAFGPHEEAGSQTQSQKTNAPSSGPLGTWQQLDSFYGPPAGFTAPFISPPGSIPGVQGPPHMVVYNHYAPVGQFGQVGLSYMGTTYLPSGKQPDWNRNPTSSSMGGGEGDMNSLNMVSMQRTAPSVPTQVQHLAPGPSLLSMGSPLPMFEVPPFQAAPDASVHSRWSHVHASPIHSIPQSMPLQPQAEGAVQLNSHGPTNHHPLTANGFPKPHSSSSLEDGRSFGANACAAVSQFPDELGLVDPPSSAGHEASALLDGSKNGSGGAIIDSASVREASGSKRNFTSGSTSHRGSTQQKNPSGQHQYNHFQRGPAQRSGSGAEWSNRRMAFHGRNHSGGERVFPPTKVKQVYVAKQSTGGTSATG